VYRFNEYICNPTSTNDAALNIEIVNLKDKYIIGQEVVCRQYHKMKGIVLNTNYTYQVQSIDIV
jgi:hypothetical protein